MFDAETNKLLKWDVYLNRMFENTEAMIKGTSLMPNVIAINAPYRENAEFVSKSEQDNTVTKKWGGAVVWAKKKGGKEERTCFAMDDVAFLLNDDGKTLRNLGL